MQEINTLTDFSNSNEDPIFEQVKLKDITFTASELYGTSFYKCKFEACDFSKTVFEGCTFNACRFTNCNLTLIRLPHCYLDKTAFLQCKMIGIDWTAATWHKDTAKRKKNFTLTFEECALNYSIFIGLNLRLAQFIRCTLYETGFEHADLHEGDFSGSDLSGAIFAESDLTKVDFSEAKNYNINACRNTLTQAKFSFPEAMSLLYSMEIELEK